MPVEVMARVRVVAADGDPGQAVDAAANEWFGGHGWQLECLIDPPTEEREAA